ncbi:ribosome production factor 2 [Nematocida major]|uniref:ribosome production factor 2 n=1 Tax=Nematocida major TaxID=1912982 RepID=UPI0020087AE4|nr:ribosome production factor 2 [Nematocida major]KAH9386999.1 ribosome production factor 2 [Nematocida major]
MKKEKKPAVIEPSKKLLVISPSMGSPVTQPLIALFLGIKKDAVKYVDKDGIYQPTTSNASVSNGKLEALMKKLDCSLFAYIYSNKKGESRVIIGRTYEFQIVDLAQYKVSHEMQSVDILRNTLHVLMVHRDPLSVESTSLNLVMDLLRDSIPGAVGLGVVKYGVGLDVTKDRITLDVVEVEASPFRVVPVAGPVHFELMEEHRMGWKQQKEASKQIRQTEKKVKNVEKGFLNNTLGVLHIEKQDLREVQLSKGKALRGSRRHV